MAIVSNFPAIRPSLNLDFANARALDPRITFGRASAATYYDGKTVAKAEENLLTYSQQITAGVGAWAGQGLATGTTVNSAQAPDATVTASIINVTSGAGGVRYYSTIPAGTYTVSVYIRSVSGSTDFAIDFENLYSTSFTLSSVWQRVTATVTFAVTRAWIDFQISAPGIFEIWGAQLEQRSQVTAYTPTTSQPITNYIPVLQTAPAGVPRFDHNPVTGESLGLLVEEQRTNVLTYSEQFSNAAWTKNSCSIAANTLIAPDGTLSADKVIEDLSSSVSHDVRVVGTQVTEYTVSVYAKAGERKWLKLTNATGGVCFDLGNGVVGSYAGTGAGSAAIFNVGNGWYRCSVKLPSVASGAMCLIGPIQSDATLNYAGDGYSGIYIWGAQLEAGAFPTSYVKTEASQVTRAADSASMTGANFSSWYRQDEGVLLFHSRRPLLSAGAIQVSDGTTSNRMIVSGDASNFDRGYVTVDGAMDSTISVSSNTGGFDKKALAYRFNDIAYAKNGSAPGIDTASRVPVVNQLSVPTLTASFHIQKFSYYPKRLTDAQLQALTA